MGLELKLDPVKISSARELSALVLKSRQAEEEKPDKLSKASIPEDLKRIIPSYIGRILTDVEFFIYVNEIRDWMADHSDWKLKEDIDDLNGIALEKVMQFRLLSNRKRAKNVSEIDREFTASKGREMVHRTNLGAKRAQRIVDKKTTNITNNVINIAGEIDAQKLEKIKTVNQIEEKQEEEMFPTIEIVDAQIVNEEESE